MESEDSSFVSDEVFVIFSWVAYGVGCQIINAFGIVTNIINIVCFVKQGFKDSVNISLLGLAVSDLGSLVTLAWSCFCLTPAVREADLPFDPFQVTYLVSAMPHMSFTRVSSCITAMITMERCCCILFPLKIKSIITPKRTTVTTICIFIIFFWSGAPVYAVNILGMTFSPFKNKTIVGLISTADRTDVEKISFAINNFCIPFSAFLIISIGTIILTVQLSNKAKWRKKIITNTQAKKVSSKNQKTAKMVVTISILFIVCFLPVSINMLAMAFIPDLSVTGKQVNVSLLACGLGLILESINSSMNIFIYYHMSSNYKTIFSKIFIKEIVDVNT